VAFYSILSFAPLLVLMTAIVGLVFGHESAHGALVGEARQVIGNHGADTVHSLLTNAQKPASGIFASTVAFLILLFGASGVFAELQDALNIMWDAPQQETSGFMGAVKQRLFSFGMVLSVGFLLLVLLILSSGLAFLGHAFGQVLPLPGFVLQIANFVVSFAVETGLFALMFKYVPSVHVAWHEVIVGALGTALLFTGGKFLLGIYLGKASVTSTYGAAGSLVAVVVWIYYSAQIFFFGAEFTRVHADKQRGKTVPKPAPLSQSNEIAVPQASQFVEMPLRRMAAVASSSASLEPVHVSSTSAPAFSSPSLRAVSETAEATRQDAGTADVPGKPVKPRLLAAVAIGFLLGRLSRAAQKK
jgi:membrane protein